MSTAPKASPIPSSKVKGKAKLAGTRNCVSACDQRNGSVSFQLPYTKNNIASKTEKVVPRATFQPGKSKAAIPRPYSSEGAAL